MNPAITLGLLVTTAYIIQIFLGLRQIKHFNQVYTAMRRQGRVAIGRRAGKIKSGTIVLFAIDKAGKVLDAKRMQGVTIGARFKTMPAYIGQDIHYFDRYNPLVRKENKLLQTAIEDAREVFLRTEAGSYEESPQPAPLTGLAAQIKLLPAQLKLQLKSKKRSG
ncbi:transcriptional regulator [Streptococcus chenjunshii]|uniref:Transcriptional regulator n=1 Tax=Streptococcus chenjunshii TaxID=2173853 RepID=A0A372KNC5_9STRE|nr:transcriptional regulator GutM [Streptococcus chenjunshii]AXQ77838.1 transcriptional regulator [Streptococcus chenjunshii]RFU51349.1 transcriptional regulator [Streptococcus chenjunshii]RFU53777.1 transcriptional regulator [Streptococcus chenjunshii]